MSKKIALVTGAGSGIGRATALGLAADGFCVVLAGRRLEAVQAVAQQIAEQGGEALAVAADVRDSVSVDALFAQVEQIYGRLDVIFNNAGIGAPAVPIDELDVAKWTDVLQTNVTGVFLCCRAAFGLMRRQQPQGGRIINNGSISAHTPRSFSMPYTASKHAVLGITKSLALDGREFNIACSQIDIGNADTPMGGRMKEGVPQADCSIRAEAVMDPLHVGEAILMMANLPIEANVQFMTVMATKMPFVGRG